MRVDKVRHHGLAGEVHVRGAGGHADIGGARRPVRSCEPSTTSVPFSIDAPVADDEAGAFERRDAGGRRRRLRARRNGNSGKETKRNSGHGGSYVQSAHHTLLGERNGRIVARRAAKAKGSDHRATAVQTVPLR